MICTVIQHKTLQGILAVLAGCRMAEVRLDRCSLSLDEIEECFSQDVPAVATCRVSEVAAAAPSLSLEEAASICEDRLLAAIEGGAAYVDVEIDAPAEMAGRIVEAASESGVFCIRSFHDFEGTGSLDALYSIADKCFSAGADIVKIVTCARSSADVERVMSLYGRYATGTLLAFCMGDEGRMSRIDCLREGAPFTYASTDDKNAAAPGQWTASQMSEMVYGGFRFIGTESVSVPMPASKSLAQRAIIAAALAGGVSHIRRYSPCDDSEAALSVAETLGAGIIRNEDELEIEGIDAGPQCLGLDTMHVGESGLLARLMVPLLSMVSRTPVVLTGEKSLSGRPLCGLKETMSRFSVSLAGASGPDGTCHVPVRISGHLSSGQAEVSGKDGSQAITGLLMSLPLSEAGSVLTVHEPKSIPYILMTLEVMKSFGVHVSVQMYGGKDFLDSGGDAAYCTDMEFGIGGGQRYKAADIALEGDWSAAANFLVAGAVFGKVTLSGLSTSSSQADVAIMDILADAGASLSQTGDEKGDITVHMAPLYAFSADLTHCPDLFPAVAVLAAFCNGTSHISGTGRLGGKECDRGVAILGMLSRLGVEASISDGVMSVEGHPLAWRILTGNLLRGGSFSSWHDHRMVMALKVAELGAGSPVDIDDIECVSKSCPEYLSLFRQMTAAIVQGNNQI